jgi:hypothetical protein
MLTTQDLVGIPDAAPEVPVQIRVTRAFCIAGRTQPIGTKLQVSTHLARELVAANKAQLVGSTEGPQ